MTKKSIAKHRFDILIIGIWDLFNFWDLIFGICKKQIKIYNQLKISSYVRK